MAKVKSDKMPHYELLYLISNKYSETELEPVKAKIAKLIENHQGEITYSEDLGKRRLAYAIKGFRYGYYQLVEFDLPGAELIKLENDIKLDHEILRHQVVRIPKRTLEEIKKAAAIVAERLAKSKEEEKEVVTETAPEKVIASSTEETAPATETPVLENTEVIDANLDKILDSDSLVK